jgi:hypothetical protein
VSFLTPARHIQVRFNTKNDGGPLPWRIFIEDEQFLASHVNISGGVFGELSYEGDVQKYNLACTGRVTWDGTVANIKAKRLKRAR